MTSSTPTLRQLLAQLAADFNSAKFEDPKLEARHLLFDAMDMDLSELLLRGDDGVPPEDLARIEAWKTEMLKGRPLAYLSGKKGFFKSEFVVRPGVLIPRPETELVVETALALAAAAKTIADFGCGSGCIGLSFIKEISTAKLIAVDQSSLACEVTRENVTHLDLLDRVQIVNKSVEAWDFGGSNQRGPLDLVVANPPYIAPGDLNVQKSVHDFEPHEALYAADEGLAAFRSWTAVAFTQLKPTGIFVTEIGAGQSVAVQEIMRAVGFQEIRAYRDLNKIERVLSAKNWGDLWIKWWFEVAIN